MRFLRYFNLKHILTSTQQTLTPQTKQIHFTTKVSFKHYNIRFTNIINIFSPKKMDTLCRPNLDLSNPCTISSVYSKNYQKHTSSLCYKYRFSCSKFGGSHSKCKGLIVAQGLPKTKVSSHVGNDESGESNRKLVKRIANGLIGLAAAVSLCLDSPAMAESMTIAFPASRTHEVLL